MAILRSRKRCLDENTESQAHPKASGKAAGQGNKRRALGDLSKNVAGPAAGTRSQACADKAAAGAKTRTTAAATTSSEAAHGRDAPAGPAPTQAAAPEPATRVTRSQTRGQQPGARVSIDSLPEFRSSLWTAGTRHSADGLCLSPLPDIDAEDAGNPLAACDYVNDIYQYFQRVEPKFRVSPDYMDSQVDINEKMRGILIDWLVEVHLKFKLMPETLFLTVNLIDRYLEACQVTRRDLQLVGMCAMLIASKYEEVWAPEVRDYVYISDKAYDRAQILAMEKHMLSTLHFNLTVPTCYQFAARYLKAAHAHGDRKLTLYVAYIMELCLVDYGMLHWSYSLIAAAAVHVAIVALKRGRDVYPAALERHAGYSISALQPAVRAIVKLLQKAPDNSLTAVLKKYCAEKYLGVANVDPPVSLLHQQL